MNPYSFKAVIFDLDGVLTQTAKVHGKAWKTVFDEYLRLREGRNGEPFREFTHEADYLPYVDGKPRYEGVKSFLASRGITIPFGDSSDTSDRETVCGIGNKKDEMFRSILRKEGAEVFTSTIDFIYSLRAAGIRTGVASSSKNCKAILESGGIEDLFETRVDGVVSVELKLRGKPEGDIFVTAARNLGVLPAESVVVEDATSGVAAGRNGGFGLVLGVARHDNRDELFEHGADLVVSDMAEISIEGVEEWFRRRPHPLFQNWEASKETTRTPGGSAVRVNPSFSHPAKDIFNPARKSVFFLDYDGTLTPIVERPDLAVLSDEMRDVLRRLAARHTVAIVSGRMREDVEKMVALDGLLYAGSHGFDILGPGISLTEPRAEAAIPVISEIIDAVSKELGALPGVLIEKKKFSTAVHYRLSDQKDLPRIKETVERITGTHKELRIMSGKKVYEILPDIDWDKGRALRWIMEALGFEWGNTSVVYIGDDVTDEYAFRAVRTRGTGILVAETEKESAADFQLFSIDEVKELFERIIASS
ncbi:MAG: trehalose-phosphatase [Candidatus Omnitrophica bacterium]|nr:trehalose-phosphatase [Candidatus Omnitrophota bacterium]